MSESGTYLFTVPTGLRVGSECEIRFLGRQGVFGRVVGFGCLGGTCSGGPASGAGRTDDRGMVGRHAGTSRAGRAGWDGPGASRCCCQPGAARVSRVRRGAGTIAPSARGGRDREGRRGCVDIVVGRADVRVSDSDWHARRDRAPRSRGRLGHRGRRDRDDRGGGLTRGIRLAPASRATTGPLTTTPRQIRLGK